MHVRSRDLPPILPHHVLPILFRLPCSNAHPANDQVPVFGGGAHERGGDGEDDDGRADDGGAGQHVGHDAVEDEEAGEDVGEGGAGENLVLDAQAGIVPVTLPTRAFAPGLQSYKIFN